MKKNEVVVLTTIFDQNPDNARAFFESLALQTFQDFDVLFVDDGFLQIDLFKKEFKQLNFLLFEGTGNIAKNREVLINSAIDLGYQKAIFADFDDYFSLDRFAVVVDLLDNHDLVINDLTLVTNNEREENYLSAALMNDQSICIDDILESNFIGMSNSAVTLSNIHKVSFDKDLKAVDWFFFSNVLLGGSNALFTNKCLTYYTQYHDNLSCISHITVEQLSKEIDVKLLHYSLMKKNSSKYEGLFNSVIDLTKDKLANVTDYFAKTQHLKRPPFWWSIFNTTDYWRIKK